MLSGFEVHPYSEGAFKDALTDGSHCGDREALEKKPQVTYLANFLKRLDAKTLLIEDRYVLTGIFWKTMPHIMPAASRNIRASAAEYTRFQRPSPKAR